MNLLGPSKMTSILGYTMWGVGLLNQAFSEHGIPQTRQEWAQFAMFMIGGAIARVAKDGNVSNAPNPVEAKPIDVPAKVG